MSRLAKNPIAIPDGVTVEVNGQDVKVKGPKGELGLRVHDEVAVELDNNEVKVSPKSKSREAKALWGTMWSLIRNRITGVNEGFTKNLEIQGVGYRANVQGSKLVMQLGFSHDVEYDIPQGIDIAVDKQTKLSVTGIDKEQVGAVAAKIKSYRPPEPYKGKGVRYEGQYVLRKEGKKK